MQPFCSAGIHGDALSARNAAAVGKRRHTDDIPNTDRAIFIIKSSTLLMNFTPPADPARNAATSGGEGVNQVVLDVMQTEGEKPGMDTVATSLYQV